MRIINVIILEDPFFLIESFSHRSYNVLRAQGDVLDAGGAVVVNILLWVKLNKIHYKCDILHETLFQTVQRLH